MQEEETAVHEVDSCLGCPLESAEEMRCAHRNGEGVEVEPFGPPPANCPLRAGPYTIKLKQGR